MADALDDVDDGLLDEMPTSAASAQHMGERDGWWVILYERGEPKRHLETVATHCSRATAVWIAQNINRVMLARGEEPGPATQDDGDPR